MGWVGWWSKTNDGESKPAAEFANWLLVFDNVESANFLKEYTPLRGPGSVLFTSRDPFAKHYLSPNSGLDLSPLPPPAAADLLQSLTYRLSQKRYG
jgi:hypothetical protein